MKFILKTLNKEISVKGVANVHFFEFPENYSTENDKHPFYELLFVAGGKLMVESEDYTGLLCKDEVIIHRANEYHALACVGSVMPTVIIIGFDLDSGDIDKFSSSPIRLSDADVKKLAEIVKEGRNVFAPPYDVPVYDMKKKKNQPFGAEQLLKNLLEYFLVGLLRNFSGEKEAEEQSFSSKLSVSEIINYIDVNYKEKITIDELAFIFKTNRSTLCKEFKMSTGKTITEYVADKKLESAKRKIKSTDKTFTEIAEELNFESIHYFTRFFKKHTGVSPREYRNL
ncbi:MAG: helix-turn-helix transcriptional regulator [Clostridia bacterium]|nr:helix-turn-helix transcriptional regulator [Clostridia bacterium]